MNFDMSQYYEKNLNKYYSQLDIYFSKILIYNKNQINDIIASLEDVFSLAKKESKDYIIYLSLNEKRQYSQLKIKSIETRIKEYENKIKSIKNKNKIIDDIPNFKEEEMSNIKIFDSFNKMNNAIRTTADIDNMSKNILTNLEGQTTGMKNTSNKILVMNGNLDESKNNLDEMLNKKNKDKKVIIFTGAVLSFILIFMFLLKLYKKFSK